MSSHKMSVNFILNQWTPINRPVPNTKQAIKGPAAPPPPPAAPQAAAAALAAPAPAFSVPNGKTSLKAQPAQNWDGQTGMQILTTLHLQPNVFPQITVTGKKPQPALNANNSRGPSTKSSIYTILAPGGPMSLATITRAMSAFHTFDGGNPPKNQTIRAALCRSDCFESVDNMWRLVNDAAPPTPPDSSPASPTSSASSAFCSQTK